MVSPELIVILLLLGAAVVMFMLNRPRLDVVALLMVATLPFTGVITISEAIAGFSDPNIVLIALLFVLGEGLVRTGIARRVGDWISRVSAGSESRLVVLLMASVGIMGSIMSSTAIVAIFIPVVLRICQSTGTAPSRLMMPLSVAALISGMMTMVATTPNLIVNAELLRQGEPGFEFFTNTPIGITVLVLGIAYMLFVRRWLPDAQQAAPGPRRRPNFRDWIERYKLEEREVRVRIRPESPVVGQTLKMMHLRASGVNLLAIERDTGRLLRPVSTTQFRAGDVLLLDIIAPKMQIEEWISAYRVDRMPLCPNHRYLTDQAQELGMVEALVPPESSFVGQSVLQARMRNALDLTAIGLRRGSQVIGQGLLDEKLRVGDTLLLTGFWRDIQDLQHDTHELVPLSIPIELDEVLPAHHRAPHALAILALVVVLMVSGLVPNVHAALLGCLLLGACGCIDMQSAYSAINWKSLVLIVGMMPFSLALYRTGGVDLAAEALLGLFGEGSPRVLLAAIFVITAFIGMFISNTATAILMAPVAITVATYLDASPLPFAMMVALAASTAFMTPVSSPVNTLVVVPGNYRFADFVRIGFPFSVVVLAVSVLLVPLLLPL